MNMGSDDNLKNVLVAKSLTEKEKHNTNNFLKEIQINFALSYADMPGLDLELVVHNLIVRPYAKLVK